MTPKELLALCREKDVKAVNLCFCDLNRTIHRLTIPNRRFREELFTDGHAVHSSILSIDGLETQKDLLLIPQSESNYLDPLGPHTTLNIFCDLVDANPHEDFLLDARQVARKSRAYLGHTGIGDSAEFAAEVDFQLFTDAQFAVTANGAFFDLESATEANPSELNSVDPGNVFGDETSSTEGARSSVESFNAQLIAAANRCGLNLEGVYESRRGAGQGVVGMAPLEMVHSADRLLVFQSVLKRVAECQRLMATTMPKTAPGHQGNGQRIHFSLSQNGKSLFAGNEFSGLSEAGFFALGGILRHAPALAALANATTNSYRRLADHFAPRQIAFSRHNPTAACRVPPPAGNLQFRGIILQFPDSTGNPHLLEAGILMAAIDGIQNKIQPTSMDENETAEQFLPLTLQHACDALENDHQFLLRGDVFSLELIESWLKIKRNTELRKLAPVPHPGEFALYF